MHQLRVTEKGFSSSQEGSKSPHQGDLLIHREEVRDGSSEGQQKKLHQIQQNRGRNWKTYLKFEMSHFDMSKLETGQLCSRTKFSQFYCQRAR